MRIFLVSALFFSLFSPKSALAANLINVRTGNNGQFTRVVFEFQDPVLFEKPEIKDGGLFSVVFINSTTTLPPIKSFAEDPRKLVRSIEFAQQESNLIASIQLSTPFSTLNSFSLSHPNQVIIDAYQMPLIEEKIEGYEPYHNNQATDESSIFQIKQLSAEKTDFPPIDSNQASKVSRTSEHDFVEKDSHQTLLSSSNPFSHNDKIINKLYLLAILNVLTSLILLGIIFMLLRKKPQIKRGNILEIVGFIKRSDSRIRIIDDQLKRELKKFEEL